MQIDEIAVGGAVEIEVILSNKAINFKSQVALIKNNSILISCIKFNDHTIGFPSKYKLNFLYVHNGKLYKWENAIIKLVRYDGTIYHKVDLSGDGKLYNRRDFFRLYIGEKMPIYINTANGATAIQALVKDISESGIGFITREKLDIDRTVRIKLKNNNTVIDLSGIIVRKEYLEHLKSYLYGCKFNEKNNDLGKFIARRQSEILRKQILSPIVRARKSHNR